MNKILNKKNILFLLALTSLSLSYLFIINSRSSFAQDLNPEQIYEKINDAVVVIISYDFNGNPLKQGSGVVISEKGIIVTNYHVYDGCEKLEIMHNDKLVKYNHIIGVDVEKDILLIDIKDNTFPAIQLGNSDDLKVGQRVYAVGSPLGFENSMSEGIISGLRNSNDSYRQFIQITASISKGSSGGAVVNSKGELIGISTLSMQEGQNLNFAIPINEVLKIQPSDNIVESYSNDLFYQGYNALGSKEFHKAIDLFNKYIKLYPNDPVAYYNRGIAYFDLNEYQNCINDSKKAIKLDPSGECGTGKKGSAQFNLGGCYSNLEDYETAMNYYSDAITQNPFLADSYFERGNCYSNLQQYDLAWVDYEKAMDLNPDDYPELYYLKGKRKTYFNKDHYGAIECFSKAINLKSDYKEAYFDRAMTFLAINRIEEACKDWKRAYYLGKEVALKFINHYCE